MSARIIITVAVEKDGATVIAQQVSLCKCCGKPVDELFKTSPRLVPSLTVDPGIDGVHGTQPVQPVQVVRDREKEPGPSNLNPSPFPTHGLQPHELAALTLMIAFFRRRRSLTPIEHGEFNDAIWAMGAETALSAAVDRDRVMGECWSPAFWKTRPEFTVTVETIAPVPAILEEL